MAAATHHRAGEALPRPLMAIGVPCAGLLLTAIFLVRGFPYDELGAWIAKRIEQRHGIHLAIGYVEPTLQLAGPALEGRQLRATFQDRPPQQIDRALVRPAWSMSWLTGEPALHLELEGPPGRLNGTLRWNGGPAWVGSLRGARPEAPPIADWIPIGGLEGDLEAKLDVARAENGIEGRVEFEIRDGSISIPGFTAPLPFEHLTGELDLGGDAYARLTSLRFEGPSAKGSGSGKIGRAQPLERAPIGFEFELEVDSEVARTVRASGVKVSAGGSAIARISGTVADPKIR